MSQDDGWGGEGYGVDAGLGGGIHFRLRKDVRNARLRLVSTAIRYTDVFVDKKSGESKQLRKVAWLAILREAVGKNIMERVVIFHAGPSVYGSIKELDESDQWGDPLMYDINIDRKGEGLDTEYVVTPCRKPDHGPITKDQAALVKEANIDLKAEIAKIVEGKALGGVGVQDGRHNGVEDEEVDVFAGD